MTYHIFKDAIRLQKGGAINETKKLRKFEIALINPSHVPDHPNRPRDHN